jgi:hypothetical protein
MSPAPSAVQADATAVAEALAAYRDRLDADTYAFSKALFALAKFNAGQKPPAAFNQTSPQDKAALRALAKWRRDAQHLLHRVRAIPTGAHGRALAERWLKALIAALDLEGQALALLDPKKAAAAAGAASSRIEEYQRLETRLYGVLE